MLINPYTGCTHDCFFCYALSYRGRFALYRQKGIVTVCEDFDRVVAQQLDSLNVACCGYLSPVTDPFQPINRRYRLSEKIIRGFVERNLPIEFITKGKIPDEAIALIKHQAHSFGQVSILTTDESLRKKLVPGGAPTTGLFGNISRLAQAGKHAVCRIDPLIPGVNDADADLETLVRQAGEAGARHIVASYVDIRAALSRRFWNRLAEINPYAEKLGRALFIERFGTERHVALDYRRQKFAILREITTRYGLTFALCMEYSQPEDPTDTPNGLNEEFATSANCEGIDIPVYRRHGSTFEPAPCDHQGRCLHCVTPNCGVPDLAMGRPHVKTAFKLSDYKRWSR
jgi:DNA repair photolyase